MRAVLLVALAACGGKAAAPAPAPTAPTAEVTGEFLFDWGPPCRVPVLERSHRKGHDLTLRYTVEVTRREEGVLSVDMVDVIMLEANGVDVSGPQHAAVRAHLQEMYAAFPAILVGEDGHYLGTESLDDIIEFTSRDSPDPAAARAVFDSPTLREQMAVKFAEPWVTWVSHWIEWSLDPGERIAEETSAPGADGGEIPFQATVEHLGIENGLARLRYAERIEGDALKRFMEPTLRSMVVSAPDPAEAERIFAELTVEGYREGSYEVLLSPVNLRPRWARQDTRAEITIGGERSPRDHEWREYELDWDRAVGCGR